MHRFDSFPRAELIKQYRNVFATAEGNEVLCHMLVDLGYTSESVSLSEEDMAHRNYATRLLSIIGGGEIGLSAIKGFIQRLMSQNIPTEKQEV